MKRLLLAVTTLVPLTATAAPDPSLDDIKAQYPLHYCNRLMISAFQYCTSSPWACELSNRYKAGYDAWTRENAAGFRKLARKPVKIPGINRAIREQAMETMAEEMRTPAVAGPFSALAAECGIESTPRAAGSAAAPSQPVAAP